MTKLTMRTAKKTMRGGRNKSGRKKFGRKKTGRKTFGRKKTGRKKTGRKKSGKRKSTDWNKHMMEVYRSMKAKDSSVKLGDAMKAAGKTYKKGN